MRRVTIRDVASIAGVSISTVSRVIAKKDMVNKNTVERVEKAIKETGFQPNHIARALATNSTDTIGVVVDRSPSLSLRNTYFVEILESIATELSKYNKDILLIFSNSINSQEEVRKVERLVNSKKIDGVIKLSVSNNDDTIEFLRQTETPTAVIGNPENKDGIICIDNDNVATMNNVINYLIEKGNKKIAFVGGSLKYVVSRDRKKGYQKAMLSNNLDFSDEDIYESEFSIEAGYEVAGNLIKKNYDAIACTDDLIAVGIANRYLENNRSVDLTGFNNTYFAAFSKLPITTVDINVRDLGARAVEELMNKIYEKSFSPNSYVETKIIIREDKQC